MVNGVLSTYSQNGVNHAQSQPKPTNSDEVVKLKPGGGDGEPVKQVERSIASPKVNTEPGRFYATA